MIMNEHITSERYKTESTIFNLVSTTFPVSTSEARAACNGKTKCEIENVRRKCDDGLDADQYTFYTKIAYYCSVLG